ncbi:MAG TPA: ABC transporter substrate-binding protein [Gammaproteobacteria bacterium]|nr:ABC transporter substrate-binding protein [Gammaproteobacteria bacterium]
MKSKRLARATICVSLLILMCLWAVDGEAQQPKYGGTLRIAMPGDMTFFNANQGPAPGYFTFWVWNNIFSSLLTMTPPPEWKLVPELATSWEVLDGGKTWIFHLQEGVKFHDGTDFDAAAAKWNVERILDPETHSWVRPYYTSIDRVEAVDTYTLRIHMKEPFGSLDYALAGYFQGIPMASPKVFETYGKDWVRHPTGTGPFVFKEWSPGERVVLEKNPQYFKPGLPYLDRLEIRIMKDPLATATALRTGEVDFITRVPIQQALILEKSSGVRVLTGPPMAPTVALLNLRVKPFDDVRARRAIGGYGIDRAEIAKVAFLGRVQPLVSVLPPGVPDAIHLNEMYPYRPDKAKELLKELGYDEQHPLRFAILVGNQDATLADMATLIKDQMAKIGVQARINLVDQTTLIDLFTVKHTYDMNVSNFGSLLDINMRSVSFFHGAQSDYVGINDPQVEAMVLDWRRALDPEKRKQISADIQRRLADQMEWVNVTGYPFFQAYRNRVKDYAFYDQAYFFLEKVWLEK